MKHSGSKLWYFVKRFKFNSYFVRNFIIFSLFIIMPISAISIVLYYNTLNITQKEISSTNISALYRVRDICDTLVKEMETLAINTSLQTNVQVFMLSSEYDLLLNNIQEKIYQYARSFSFVYKYIDSIYIFSEKNKSIICNNDKISLNNFEDLSWYNAYQSSNTDSASIQAYRKDGAYPYLISVLKPINVDKHGRMGAVVVNINAEGLGRIIKSTDNPTVQSLYIVNNAGEILYSDDIKQCTKNASEVNELKNIVDKQSGFSGSVKINKEDYIVTVVSSQLYDWRYISVLPLSTYTIQLNSMKNFIIVVIILAVLFVLVISFLLSARSFKPLQSIMTIIDEPEKWDVENGVTKYSNFDELNYIICNIMNTIKLKKNMEVELQDRLLLLQNAQLGALQSQINPHFLFNTLDTINWIAIDKIGGNNEASNAITTLSELFRLSLNITSYLVTIQSEIEHAKLYVKLIDLRYKNKIKVMFDFDNGILKYMMPKLCLQPIIENAVYHGIKPKLTNGLIEIRGRTIDNDIIIDINDDGIGMNALQIKEINDMLQENYVESDKHIGLRNVNRRIKLIFGEDYGVKISSVENAGTKVRIIIPKKL